MYEGRKLFLMFKSLEIHTWRQIERVEIQFHPRLTILTGANGTGKTTILNLISRHFGWSIPLVGTPVRDRKTGALRYLADVWKSLWSGSTSGSQREQVFSNYSNQVQSRYMGGGGGMTPNSVIKEALLSLATFGYGNEVNRQPTSEKSF